GTRDGSSAPAGRVQDRRPPAQVGASPQEFPPGPCAGLQPWYNGGNLLGKRRRCMKEQALALLRQYNESEALVQHGREVGAILEHFATKSGEDPDYWGSVGLLHDVDYEKYPEQHCEK